MRRVSRLPRIREYPCQESNLDLGVRSAALFPLSYKGELNARQTKRAALIGFPMGGSPQWRTRSHYKELTCENGRDDGRAKLTLLKRRRCGWLVMAVPLRLGVVQVLRANLRASIIYRERS